MEKPKGFTIVEILAVVIILGLLLGLLLPVLGAVREQSRRIQCLNNLRQHGMAWHLYLTDHDDHFPPYGEPPQGVYAGSYSFGGKKGERYNDDFRAQYRILNRYLEIYDDTNPNLKIFQCPDDIKPSFLGYNLFDVYGTSYFANPDILIMFESGISQPRPLSTITRPKDRVYLERDHDINIPGHGGKGAENPKTPIMVLFVDGHVGGPFLFYGDFDGIDGRKDDTKKVFSIPQ